MPWDRTQALRGRGQLWQDLCAWESQALTRGKGPWCSRGGRLCIPVAQ